MSMVIPAGRIATLVGDVPTPAYAGLAAALVRLIADGRLPLDQRLPSERELARAMALSRTTVTRAYTELVDAGYALARQGAGTFTRLPGTAGRYGSRSLLPRPGDGEVIDLSCAAPLGTPGLASAYAEAAAELPAYFGDHGYHPSGLPELRAAIAAGYAERGLDTEPDQVLITSGAIAGIAAVAAGLVQPGDRVLVESPVYPNAVGSFRAAGARIVATPVDPTGWDLDGTAATLRQSAPRLAYLIPDFQNPTGLLLDDAGRARLGEALRATRTTPVVDETHVALRLDDGPIPLPFAAHAPGTISIGSASKAFWGGLRVGWLRVPTGLVDVLTGSRLGLDLGAPVLEQLVLARLLRGPERDANAQRERLREQRDVLAAALRERLPQWRFRLPRGGLSLWCELPAAVAPQLAAHAERRGLVVTPGPTFAPEGGLAGFVRLPYTRPAAELERAADLLAEAWNDTMRGAPSGGSPRALIA